MLHTLVGSKQGSGVGFPFSFSDRSAVWPDRAEANSFELMDRGDFGAIADGLIAGTQIATELGWQSVEDLRAGDRVVTFDNGMRPLKAVRVSTLWTAEKSAPRAVWPLEVPKSVLGNRDVIRLLPDQAVLIESDEAEALYGDPFTMVSAGSLDGYKGITRVPPARELTLVALEFEGDEVVYVNGTMLVHCPNNHVEKVSTVDELLITGSEGSYQRLTAVQARQLVQAMSMSA